MGGIGKNNFMVKQLHARTKIRKEDIAEVLNLLPEAMAEAFFAASPAKQTPVNLGPVSASWRLTQWGPGIYFKPTQPFKTTTKRLKMEKSTPLAIEFYEKTRTKPTKMPEKRPK